MSLEQSLNRTNQLLETIITILQTGVSAPTELGLTTVAAASQATAETASDATAPKKRGRPAKVIEATAPAGDSRYFVYEKHRTVYEIKAGEHVPDVPDAVEVSRDVYEAKKAEFAKNVKVPTETGSPAQATTTPAATHAPSTPAASNVSSQVSEQPSGDVPFPKIIERITALNKSPADGHGREGVLAVLRKWLPGDDKPTVTKLQPLGKNAEILADIEAMLNPAVVEEEEFDPLA